MPSFKKITSVFCAAAMIAMTAVPVLADEEPVEIPADEAAIETAADTDVELMAVSDIYNDFDDLAPTSLVALGTVENKPYTDEDNMPGITLYCGFRGGSGDTATNFSIESGGYENEDGSASNALALNSAKYADSNRGPRMLISTPKADTSKATMKVKLAATQELYYNDDTGTNGTNKIDVPADNEWHDLGIYLTGTTRMFVVDKKVVAKDAVIKMPVIWSKNAASAGKILFDNMTIGELLGEELARVTVDALDLKVYTAYDSTGEATEMTNDVIIPDEGDNYGVATGTFGIDVSANGIQIDWDITGNGVDGIFEKEGRNMIKVNPSDSSVTATFTATAHDYPNIKREFTVTLQGTNDFLNYVESLIDLAADNDCVVDYVPGEGEPEPEVSTYEAISGFTVPTSLNGATLTWSSSDSNVVINGANVSLKTWDAGTYQIIATITGGGGSKNVPINIEVPKARVFYNDNYTDWKTGNLVDLATSSNTEHEGYTFSSATRSGTGDHYIAISSDAETWSGGNFMNNVLTQYNDDGSRTHSMSFTRMSGATTDKDFYARFDFKLGNASTTMRMTDGSAALELNTQMGLEANVWYHMEYTILSSGSYSAVITNAVNNAAVKTVTGSNGPTKILRFEGTTNYYTFAFDNLYMAMGSVADVKATGITKITSGQSDIIAKAARVTSKDQISVSIEPEIEGVTYEITDDYEVKINTGAASKGDANVTVTATTGVPVSTTVALAIYPDDEFAQKASDDIVDTLINKTTVKAVKGETDSLTVSEGNITLPDTLYGAAITWNSSNASVLQVSQDGKSAIVLPDLSGRTNEVTLTATIKYGTDTKTHEIKINIGDYNTTAKEEFDAAVKKAAILPYVNSITKNAVGCDLGKGTAAILWNDVSFPTSASSVDTIAVSWSVEDNEYLKFDSSEMTGKVVLSDTEAHPITIKRTLEYIKNGQVLKSQDDTYTPNVQFTIDIATNDLIAERTGQLWNQNEEWAIQDQYFKSMVYDYAVKFDEAAAENFKDIKDTTQSFTAPVKGIFGSDISWSSNNQAIKVGNNGQMTVAQPTYTANVTLTATISCKTADPIKKSLYVTVAGVNGAASGGGSSGGGGGFSGSGSGGSSKPNNGGSILTGTDTVPVNSEAASKPNPNPSGFQDLDSVPWAVTAINNLYVSGVIDGKTPGMFCPNDNVTRAEFAKILIGAFNIPAVSVSSATFTDVPVGHWASSYIETAYQNGIITGYDNGAFDPDAYVTRQDMTVMVQRAMTTMGYSADPVVEATEFTDAADIASYAQEAVSTLQQAGIVNGVGDGAFEPLSTSTRAQACQMIYNVWN